MEKSKEARIKPNIPFVTPKKKDLIKLSLGASSLYKTNESTVNSNWDDINLFNK